MSRRKHGSRRQVLKVGIAFAAGCIAVRPIIARAADDEYEQPKLDRTVVHYQDHPGPDDHQCGLCTNFIAPSSCRVVDGTISPKGYCLSFAPKDIDP